MCFACASCGWLSVLGGFGDLFECTALNSYVVVTHSVFLNLLQFLSGSLCYSLVNCVRAVLSVCTFKDALAS